MMNNQLTQSTEQKLLEAMLYVRTWLMLYHQNAMQIAQEKGIWKHYIHPNETAPDNETKIIACSVFDAETLHLSELNMAGALANAEKFLKAFEKQLSVLDEDDDSIVAIEIGIFFLNKQIEAINKATVKAKKVFVDIEFTPEFEEKVSDTIQILEGEIEILLSVIYGIEFIAPHEV